MKLHRKEGARQRDKLGKEMAIGLAYSGSREDASVTRSERARARESREEVRGCFQACGPLQRLQLLH